MSRVRWQGRSRINFILKRPSEKDGRKTFQILRRETRPGEKPSHQTVKDRSLDAISRAYAAQDQSFEECETQALEILTALQEKEYRKLPKPVHNEENRRALERYWDQRYAGRKLVDRGAALSRLTRAVECLGELSLFSSPQNKIEQAISRKYPDHRQRAVAGTLSEILKFLGRDMVIQPNPEIIVEVPHLTRSEFLTVQEFVREPLDALLQFVAFHTGLRVGEIFALDEHSLRGRQLYSQYQLDRALAKRHTKRRFAMRRKIYIIPGGENEVSRWCRLPIQKKQDWRNRKHAEMMTQACQRAFPDRREKHVTFHDLRHSFAIHLVSHGVGITQVAQCLGNSVQVCQKYYAGFALQDETMDTIDRVMKSAAVAQR